ncbi:Protein of unknown function [Tistlia consotensis]|uniref:DUF2794 domain-containing protein n=1 Tax=Tistlia consotensis USBA 355 TaxID=560819 RepID=A0A1Y6BE93_9PROT|nr:DUF2794 domain-containing protein [Tistlia consotensis]SMF00261.1 Protein of unknown function [Tistlia consotensis USBA 355]SNR76073.1 Protein of unknown function [Tistlia consotensis]
MGQLLSLQDFAQLRTPSRKQPRTVYFTRSELNALLSVYSRRVASGEWRDYAIDHHAGTAIFSIFRHSQERPIFAVAKRVGGAAKSGEYLLFSQGQRLARAKTLGEVLKTFERKLQVVS